MTHSPISRRRVLVVGGLGAASIATGVSGWFASGRIGGTGCRLQPVDTGTDLAQPQILDSQGGRLAVELTAAAGARLAGRATSALGFNGTSPGPTLRVRPTV